MQSFKYFSESTNKFNIQWQLVRLNAKGIKDPKQKIDFVLNFLNQNKNIHNYNRVKNWLVMTSYGYKDRTLFSKALMELNNQKGNFTNTQDTLNDFNSVPQTMLKKVLDDLNKRKYNFQYNSTPKAHKKFVDDLEQFLKDR